LENFYQEALACKDESVHWYFLVSTDRLKDADNITIISKPWVKKSWLHRWYFDTFRVQKIVKALGIDLVYSMQNAPVRRTKAKQVVYLHQSLQFSPVRFSLFNKEQRVYAIRQKFICNIYKRHLKHADSIIVQSISNASAFLNIIESPFRPRQDDFKKQSYRNFLNYITIMNICK
jgi:hypothetical protein